MSCILLLLITPHGGSAYAEGGATWNEMLCAERLVQVLGLERKTPLAVVATEGSPWLCVTVVVSWPQQYDNLAHTHSPPD